jgi:hypothetical protein
MNHLEKLIRQYYEWQGYIVRGNVKVGRLSHGGWAGELDIVAYHHKKKRLLHIEPSLDAQSWAKREVRFKKKFAAGKRYIYSSVFPWLDKKTPIERIAIMSTSGTGKLAGGRVVTVDEFMHKVKNKIAKQGKMAKNAIPEEYDLLRTIQMAICGLSRSP